jgi:plastocyanin
MLTQERWNRRRFLATVGGSATVVSGAGCLESSGNGNSTDDDGSHDDSDSSGDHDSTESTGGSDDHEHGEEIEGPVDHADVAMLSDDTGHHFEPHVVWVETGGTVTWTNESGSHTTTAYHSEFDKPSRIPDDADPWDSGMFSEEGKTFDRTFDVEGVYDYFCIPHEYRGMVGTVIVGEPDPHDQPGLADPQDDLPEEAREVLAELNEQVNEALGHTHD